MKNIVFVDIEINPSNKEKIDFGCITYKGMQCHSKTEANIIDFIETNTVEDKYIGGHNIIYHDLQYINIKKKEYKYIDTLYISPLLFPANYHHNLSKDDKFKNDMLSNPLNDAKKSMELFYDEINEFNELDEDIKNIYYMLLHNKKEFFGFFDYLDYKADINTQTAIKKVFKDRICVNANILNLIEKMPVELAYCLAIIYANEKCRVMPVWLYKTYPKVEECMRTLRNTPCSKGCVYCNTFLNVKTKLKEIFGYDNFRKYNNEPLQEMAAQAAVQNKSLLAVFPTGGGKSITFQLPALMAGDTQKGLTVVISPLQSLMKDQVDNLSAMGIADAVTINGLLNPIERKEAYERIKKGIATILYISPESLRSKIIESLLLSRNVVRFVIDEAHCFSAWGQDFRVDYLYIGDFIKQFQEKKNISYNIPVSCFTATAKQKVISDICEYFKQKLNLELEIYATDAGRTNLQYQVLKHNNEDEKYTTLRNLIEQKNCPTIVYVSRTKRTINLAKKLCEDGFIARAFHGQMDNSEKIQNQEDFISGNVQVIVATSAFGMGVDKKDVKLVIHYDISDSLENYIQESGRAGRDQSIQAECHILFNEDDLDKHFILLNQTKLSLKEINQIWKAIKDLSKGRRYICRSPLEIARQAGWDESIDEIETRVKTAVAELEKAKYIERGKNVPKVYATGILTQNMQEAAQIIRLSDKFKDKQKENAIRIMKMLISKRSWAQSQISEAESRTDYIADILGLGRQEVFETVHLMREEKLIADTYDLTAYIKQNDNKEKSFQIIKKFTKIEKFLLNYVISSQLTEFNLKEINGKLEDNGIKNTSVKSIKTLLYYWTIKGYIKKYKSKLNDNSVQIELQTDEKILADTIQSRLELSEFIIKYLYSKVVRIDSEKKDLLVEFSVLELQKAYKEEISFYDIQDTLLYLSKIDSLQIEGGFLVLYNAMGITRREMDNRIKYKVEDYKQLKEFYTQRIQQIHIVGEYAKMMIKDYDSAIRFVNDYFQMEYKSFLSKYFSDDRLKEINLNITPQKYKQIFENLSDKQKEIIADDTSKYIVVTAGPGSGKTRVLVHKLASLMLLEDVKHEQLLMLTFSRSAAVEFKQRLTQLIGNATHHIEIKTFHSYCFDLLGKIGNIENSKDIVKTAGNMIKNGEVEIGRITKTVVVIDEAQDMDINEYLLIQALIERNEDMRVIAVGDDDQNIYEFRGSNSDYLKSLITEYNAKQYNLVDNYRSCKNIIDVSNKFVNIIPNRLKTEHIRCVSDKEGIVQFIKHKQNVYLEYPIVEAIKNRNDRRNICVLTNDNEEAMRVTGLLNKEGIPAKLIQDDNQFNVYNLAELRYFTKKIFADSGNPIISDNEWNNTLIMLRDKYSKSECLDLCLKILNKFADTNPRKYKTDLEVFLKESPLSDFCEINNEDVIVSTIHKSKGREFNAVYMLLDNVSIFKDEDKRKIYVGFTRAKNELHLHYNSNNFDRFANNKIIIDNKDYPEPKEMVHQLCHKDIYLGFEANKENKSLILNLRSGDELKLYGNTFYYKKTQVGKLAKDYQKKIKKLFNKNYYVSNVKIKFILAWRDKKKKDSEENAIILPEIYFSKKQ